MAVVKTQDLQLPTGRFKLKVKCDAGGEFSADFPSPMVYILGRSKAKGKSLKECETDFWAGVQDFKEAHTQKRKVIAYMMEGGGDLAFRCGIAMQLTAVVYEETKIAVDGEKPRCEYSEVESTLPDEMTYVGNRYSHYTFPQNAELIDWTPEREAFFKNLGDAMLAVVKAVSEIRDADKLLALMESGSQLKLIAGDGVTRAITIQ